MTARDRRALVVGGLILAVAVVVLRMVPWSLRALSHRRAEAVESGATAARARDILAGAGAVRDSLARALTAIVGLAPRLVDGQGAAEAQASLSALVSMSASRQGLKVVRLDALPDSAAGVFSRVGLHAEFEGDIRGMVGLFRTLETGDPLLTVPVFAVTAADPSPHRGTSEVLRIECMVEGYYLPRGRT